MDQFNSDEVLEKLTLEFISKSPILGIGAIFFSQERQDAFRLCYRSMRIIDNIVDDIKEKYQGKVPPHLRDLIDTKLSQWILAIQGKFQFDKNQQELIDLLKKIDLPIWPWEKLVESMKYDIDNNGFESFPVFLKYTEGAAVSPGAIFMHLCGINDAGSIYTKPTFDIMETARPLARFSYLVHIIRDFQEDHNDGLNYFSDDFLAEFGLTIPILRKMAKDGKINNDFRLLIKKYQELADGYRIGSRQMLDRVGSEMQPRYLLSLEVLFSLYLQIFERIDQVGCNFTTAEMNPSPEEIKSRVIKVVSIFNQ
ncbi:MAG: squalene/phytoene synthase family protein [Candidatus Kerfeldbacteria bacterium]